jgi:ubiquinone biosynthesis O-methyltransferase
MNESDFHSKHREFRSKKIKDYINTFYPELKKDISECSVLDLGCGPGKYACDIAPFVKNVKAIDCDESNIQRANELKKELNIENVEFDVAYIEDYTDNDRYDIVVLADVIEHVKNPHKVLNIALFFMKEDGILYMNTPNKYWLIEAHTHIPMLGYLPKGLAVKLSKKTKKYSKMDYSKVYMMSFSKFRKLLKSFAIKYKLKTLETTFVYKMGKKLIDVSPFFWHFAPAFQVIITRMDGRSPGWRKTEVKI